MILMAHRDLITSNYRYQTVQSQHPSVVNVIKKPHHCKQTWMATHRSPKNGFCPKLSKFHKLVFPLEALWCLSGPLCVLLTHGAAQAEISCTDWAKSNPIAEEITTRESILLCSLFISNGVYYWYFKIRFLFLPKVIKPKFRESSIISHCICL